MICRASDFILEADSHLLINGLIGMWEFGQSASRATFRKAIDWAPPRRGRKKVAVRSPGE
jgi:hypothetical protein